MARAAPSLARRADKPRARTPTERSRRRFARRQWARRWLTWKYVVAALLVLVLVGGALWTVFLSSALAVQGVEVTGTSRIADADVLAAADVPTGGALATVDLRAIERRVQSLASVRDADVTRQWPHDVRIAVEERIPVAVVDRGGRLRALDADGILFGSFRTPPEGLPRVQTDVATDSETLREAATVVGALPDEVAAAVDHVEVRSIDAIDLLLRDGRKVRWGSADESAQKAEVLVALLTRQAQVYDVSVPGQPTTTD